MQSVQKRVQKTCGIGFSRDIRAVVRGINKLDPVRRDFIVGHMLHHGPDVQKKRVRLFLNCVLGD